MFFSREHEPIHVHVRGHNGDAKFNWNGEGFVMEYVHNIKANDLKRIERMIAEKDYLRSVYTEGAQRASSVARRTLRKVYKRVGFVEKPF